MLSDKDVIKFSQQLSFTMCESIDHASKLRNFEIRFSFDEERGNVSRFPSHSHPREREARRFSRAPRFSCQDNRIPRVTTRANRVPLSIPSREISRDRARRADTKKEFPFKTIARVLWAARNDWRCSLADIHRFPPPFLPLLIKLLIAPRWSNNGRPTRGRNYFLLSYVWRFWCLGNNIPLFYYNSLFY